MAAVSGCRNLLAPEWEAEDDPIFAELTQGKYPVQNGGVVSLPDGPGLGIAMDFAEFGRRFPFHDGRKMMPGLERR